MGNNGCGVILQLLSLINLTKGDGYDSSNIILFDIVIGLIWFNIN